MAGRHGVPTVLAVCVALTASAVAWAPASQAARAGQTSSRPAAAPGAVWSILQSGLLAGPGSSQGPGAPDPAFSGDGLLTFAAGTTYDQGIAFKARPAPGGMTVVFGVTYDGPYWISRLTSAGALDATFAKAGLLTLPDMNVSDLAVAADGRIVVVGGTTSGGTTVVRRYTTAGSPDATFSGDGTLSEAIDVYGSNGVLALLDDGRPVVALGGDGSTKVVRYTAAGARDPSFSGDGLATVAIAADGVIVPAAIAKASAGSVVVMADSDNDNPATTVDVVRLRTDGTPDPAFSGDGRASTGLRNVNAIAVDSSNRIVAAGAMATDPFTVAVQRLTATGTPDAAFHGGTPVLLSSPRDAAYADAVATTSTGGIYVAVTDNATEPFLSDVWALTSTGAPDSAFSGDGRATVSFTDRVTEVYGLAVDASGRLVLSGGGSRCCHSDDRPYLARWSAAGIPDPGFDGDGLRLVGPTIPRRSQAEAVATMDDGRVVAVGEADDLGLIVLRATAAGTLDPSFSGDGWTTLWLGEGLTTIAAKVDSAGRVLVLATRRSGAIDTPLLIRFTTAGIPDATYGGGDGIAEPGITDAAPPMALLPDGRVVLTGYSEAAQGFVVERLSSSGGPDATFGVGGTALLAGDDSPTALALDPQGRVVLGMIGVDGAHLIRLGTTGTPDAGYGSGGRAALPADLFPEHLATQSSGAAVVADTFSTGLVRFTAAGVRDTTFGTSGTATIKVDEETQPGTLLVDGHDRVVVLGRYRADDLFRFGSFITRLTPTGKPDQTFAGFGSLLMTGGPSTAAAIGKGDAVLLAGSVAEGAGRQDLAIRRLVGGDGPPLTSAFRPLDPARLLDTRAAIGVPTTSRPAAGATVTVQVTGRGGVPATGVSAVVLTVTATAAGGAGFVTAYAGGMPRPGTANLNLDHSGQTISNQVVVPVGPTGTVSLYTKGPVHLIADVAGWFQPALTATAGRYSPLTPARLMDTRSGAVPAAGSTRTLLVAGRGGVPASGAAAVVLNITGTGALGAGYVTAYPGTSSRPTASNLYLEKAGQTRAVHATVRLGSDGTVKLFTSRGTDLVIDVAGWYTGASGATSTTGLFVPVTPTRLFDTRGDDPLSAGAARSWSIATGAPLPLRDVGAAVLNVTAVQASSAGYVTVFPSGATRPVASSLNIERSGQVIPNLVTTSLPRVADPFRTGSAAFYASTQTHLVTDVFGWYLAPTP
ncbi:MAG: hypothetical protein ABIO48_10985 [Pedococcus sp.]